MNFQVSLNLKVALKVVKLAHNAITGQFFFAAHGFDRDPHSGSVRLLWSYVRCRGLSVCPGEENSSGVE